MKSLERITKNGAKILGGLALAASLATGCADTPSSKDDNNVNNAPVLAVATSFGNGRSGEVTYTPLATDEDPITGISCRFSNGNGYGSWNSYLNGEPITVPIVADTNTHECYAVDAKGKSSNTVSGSFVPLEDANEIITEYLVSKDFIVGDNVTTDDDGFQPDPVGGITVDFGIEHFDEIMENERYAVVEYISPSENLTAKLSEKNRFDNGYGDVCFNEVCPPAESGVANLYMARLPESEILERLDWFFENCIAPSGYSVFPTGCKD